MNMNEKPKSPVERLTDALADMSILAIEMEQERDEARERENEWYQAYLRKDEQLKETQAKLAAEIEEHRKTLQDFHNMAEYYERRIKETYESRIKATTADGNHAQTRETTESGQSINQDEKQPTGPKNKPVRL